MKRGWWIAAGLAAAAILLTYDFKLYVDGDNVEYMFLARAVRGGDLWPSGKYPPLFSWLLAPVQSVFGLRLLPQKFLVTAFALGSLFFLARLLRARNTPASGPWIFWAAATLVPVVEYSHYVMSEIPFLFFSLGAIVSCDRLGEERKWRREIGSRRVWLLALWLAAAFYTRTAGIAGMAAVLLWMLHRGRRRQAAALGPVLVLLLVPWMAHALSGTGSGYFRQLVSVNPYYPGEGTIGPGALVLRLAENARRYFLELVPTTAFPALYGSTYSPVELQKAFFPIWLAIPVLVPFAAGCARGLGRRDPVPWWVLSTLGLLCFWPSIWTSIRFLVPLSPFLLTLWWDGWRWPEERGLGGPWRKIRAGVLVVLVLLGIRNLVFYTIETRRYPPPWEQYFSSLEWIREHTARDAVVVDRKVGFVEYVAERKGVAFPREADLGRFLESLRREGATHVILSSLPYDDIGRFLQPAISRGRPYFRIVHATPEPRTYVLEFHPEGGAGTVAPGVQ